MTTSSAVLDAVAERLAAEPAVVRPVLRLLIGLDALPTKDAASGSELAAVAHRVNAERLAERRHTFVAGAFDTSQVRRILGGISRQAVSQRVAHCSLLAAEIAGRWRFPDWQFTSGGPAPELSRIIAALLADGKGPIAADSLMRTPLAEENGSSPADLAAQGDTDRALHYISVAGAGF